VSKPTDRWATQNNIAVSIAVSIAVKGGAKTPTKRRQLNQHRVQSQKTTNLSPARTAKTPQQDAQAHLHKAELRHIEVQTEGSVGGHVDREVHGLRGRDAPLLLLLLHRHDVRRADLRHDTAGRNAW
jgi:hypothetical protein